MSPKDAPGARPSPAERPARWSAAAAVVALGVLGGCAGMRALDCDVNSYSQWPTDRKPATYAFERLPSQQANPQQQFNVEAAARDALTQAGFSEASDAASSDVTVQVASRLSWQDPWPWGDPFGYAGFGYGRWHRGFWGPGFWGPGYGMGYYDRPRYLREVAVLIRDRKSGQALYETHASYEGLNDGGQTYLVAMFEAAMKDFPQTAVNPRRVTIPLASQ